MSKAVAVVVMLLACALAGCKRSGPAQTSSAGGGRAPLTPSVAAPSAVSLGSGATGRFGWKAYDTESFTTGPSEGRIFEVPLHATKLRVTLSAAQPVLAGVMTREQLSAGKGAVRAAKFLPLPCAFVGRASGERECALSAVSPEAFVLRDVRERLMVGSRPGANRISVALAVWACVAECKAAAAAR